MACARSATTLPRGETSLVSPCLDSISFLPLTSPPHNFLHHAQGPLLAKCEDTPVGGYGAVPGCRRCQLVRAARLLPPSAAGARSNAARMQELVGERRTLGAGCSALS